MGQFFEVQFTKRLDGTDDYGNVTDSVKFTTEDQTALFKHQPKTVVEPGVKLFGHIEDVLGRSGKAYRKFVREQQEQPDQGFTQQPSTQAGGNGRSSSNSDGMRQGMSINNATNLLVAYINAGAYTKVEPKEVVSDLEAMAREIYKIDLGEKPSEPVTVTDEDIKAVEDGTFLNDIDGLFPGATAVPANG